MLIQSKLILIKDLLTLRSVGGTYVVNKSLSVSIQVHASDLNLYSSMSPCYLRELLLTCVDDRVTNILTCMHLCDN